MVVATKFAALPWRFGRDSVVAAVKDSLKKLRLPYVDLYQIHWYVFMKEFCAVLVSE